MSGIATPLKGQGRDDEATVVVPPGYKRTELGVVPEHWEARTLAELTDCLDRDRIPLNEMQRSKMRGVYPYCGANGILDYLNAYLFNEPVILIAEDGGHFDEHETRPIAYQMSGRIWVNNHAHVLRAKVPNSQDFIFYSLVHKNILSYLSGGTRAKLNRTELNKIEVAIPRSIDEQRKIAAALSAVDRLIRGLDKLVAKKRAIKQGAMQELLTGRTRLPGFDGGAGERETAVGPLPADWEVRPLGALGPWRGGSTPSMAVPEYWVGGDIPWVSSSDVRTGSLNTTQECITRRAVAETSVPILRAGSILVVVRSGILRRFLPLAQTGRDMAINQDIKGLAPHRQFDSWFVLEMLSFKQAQILATCLKSGTTVESLDAHWFKDFLLPFPSREEQRAIATILFDLETEIVTLERSRDKVKAIKQGMMQVLLTGRVRLINEETAV